MPKFLVPVDLTQQELRNAVVQNLGTAPSSPVNGQIYYDTAAGRLRVRQAGAWVDLYDASTEAVQDNAAPLFNHANHTNLTATYDDTNNQILLSVASQAVYTDENAQDALAAAYAAGTQSGLTISYNDGSNSFSFTVTDAPLLQGQNGAYYRARANHTGTQLAATISDFDTQVRTNRLDQMAAPTAAVSLNSQKITNLLDPTAAQDAATKAYVDAVSTGLDVKPSVRAASTANVTVTYNATAGTSARGQITAAPNTLDGVSLAANDRILLKDQTAAAQNGIWVVTTLGTGANGVWDRAGDFDQDAEVNAGAFTFVEQGTVNADSGWVLTTDNPIVIGGGSGTSLAFAQFSGAGQITAGNGLTKTGNTINAVGTTNRISVAADSIDIDANYAGQTTINTVGAITTGSWAATTIPVGRGGTGATSLSLNAVLYGNNTSGVQTTGASTAAGQILRTVTSGGAPTWGSIDLSLSAAVGTSILAVANGGTGSSTQAGARSGIGATGKYASTIGDGSTTTYVVNHALNSTDVIVMVRETSSGAVVFPDITVTDANNVSVAFAVAPTTNFYRVTVVG